MFSHNNFIILSVSFYRNKCLIMKWAQCTALWVRAHFNNLFCMTKNKPEMLYLNYTSRTTYEHFLWGLRVPTELIMLFKGLGTNWKSERGLLWCGVITAINVKGRSSGPKVAQKSKVGQTCVHFYWSPSHRYFIVWLLYDHRNNLPPPLIPNSSAPLLIRHFTSWSALHS